MACHTCADDVLVSLGLQRAATDVSTSSEALAGPAVEGHVGVFDRHGTRFSQLVLAVQLLAQEKRCNEVGPLLVFIYGGVSRVPGLLLGVWALALIDGGDIVSARQHLETWLEHANGAHTSSETTSMDKETASRKVPDVDYTCVLRVYTVEVLVVAGEHDLATHTITNNPIIAHEDKTLLTDTVALALQQYNDRLALLERQKARTERVDSGDGYASPDNSHTSTSSTTTNQPLQRCQHVPMTHGTVITLVGRVVQCAKQRPIVANG